MTPAQEELAKVDAELERRAAASAMRSSLSAFVRGSWAVLEPGTPLVWNWHLDAICDHVQALLEGRLGRRKLVVNVPPGSMKSRIVSVCATVWNLLRRPDWRVICASGNAAVSLRDSMYARDLIESEWFKETFRPAWAFAADQNAKGFFKTNRGGFRKATSSGARITGDRADALFVDDPLDAALAFSAAERTAVLDWWNLAFANRVNDPQGSVYCIIAQRLHADDLPGHLLRLEPDEWEVLAIPQEWEENHRRTTGIGWKDPREVEGALMFPERFPQEYLASERRRLGLYGYPGQHQQRPTALEGGLFKLAWFKRYGTPPAVFKRIIQSWDTAMKTGDLNDPSVCSTWGETDAGFYLLNVLRRRMDYPELRRMAVSLAEAWKPTAVLVEDKASGQSLVQELRQGTRLPILAIEPRGDKVVRAQAVSPLVESGRVWLPDFADWLPDFEEEFLAFPASTHDDQVDSVTQALSHLSGLSGGGTGIIEFYRRKALAAKGLPV